MKSIGLFIVVICFCLIATVVSHKKKKPKPKPAGRADPRAVKSCQDNNKFCTSWANSGECKNNPAYMNDNCRKSCGLCGTSTAPVCRDARRECPTWKTQGYCTRSTYKVWMSANCKRSCGGCGPKWTDWRGWTVCSKSCGKGVQERRRTCSTGSCQGASSQSRDCTIKKCPTATKMECGKRKSAVGRIVGGKVTSPGDWPWQVGLVLGIRGNEPGSSKLPFCGGTIINSDTVLTAAHCIRSIPNPKRDMFVRVGDHNMNTDGAQEETIAVKKIITHEKFDSTTYVNDIAIIVLNKKLTLKDDIAAACLPETNRVYSSCVVTGWGRVEQYSTQSNILRKAELPMVNNNVCHAAYQKIDKKWTISSNMICAGKKKGGVDACQGDSGGPFVCRGNDGKYVLKGIVSWGIGCAQPEKYGVYTNTFKYIDWIEKNMQG